MRGLVPQPLLTPRPLLLLPPWPRRTESHIALREELHRLLRCVLSDCAVCVAARGGLTDTRQRVAHSRMTSTPGAFQTPCSAVAGRTSGRLTDSPASRRGRDRWGFHRRATNPLHFVHSLFSVCTCCHILQYVATRCKMWHILHIFSHES